MKKFITIAALVFVGAAGYQINQTMSHDAIVLIIGFLFGVMAGLPAALVVVASQRRQQPDPVPPMPHYANAPQQAQQPPIIVLDGGQRHRQDITATGGNSYSLMTPRAGKFKEWGE